MPVSSPATITILPSTQSSPGSIKNSANALRYASQSRADADLWASIASALQNAQSQIDNITGFLRQPIPLPDPIQISDPTGALVAQIGHMIGSDNRSYPGIWANNLYIGGDGPDTAIFFSNGTETAIGENGFIEILDPFGNAGAWLGTQTEASQVVSGSANNGSGAVRLTVTAHGYRSGDWVNVAGVGGGANGEWVISVIDANHFDLLGSTFSGSGTGTVARFFSGGAFETIAVAAGQRITNVINNGSGLCRVTIPNHGYSTGYMVITTGVLGVPGANGEFLVTVIDPNTVDLQGSVFSGAYQSGGISINWPTAKLLAQGDGSLLIQNATISITGPSGLGTTTITLQPNGIGVEVQTTVAGITDTAVLNGGNLVFTNSANGQKASFLAPQVNLWDGLGNLAVIADASAGAFGTLKIFKAGSQVITLDGNAEQIALNGTSVVLDGIAGTIAAANNIASTNGVIGTLFGHFTVGGIQVVGAQKPAITAPSGGTVIDTQARTAINSILAVLSLASGGHGLTA